jgi:hypothetical protein
LSSANSPGRHRTGAVPSQHTVAMAGRAFRAENLVWSPADAGQL